MLVFSSLVAIMYMNSKYSAKTEIDTLNVMMTPYLYVDDVVFVKAILTKLCLATQFI